METQLKNDLVFTEASRLQIYSAYSFICVRYAKVCPSAGWS